MKLFIFDYFLSQKLNSLTGQSLIFDLIIVFFAEFLIFLLPFLIILFYLFSKEEKRIVYRKKFFHIFLSVFLSLLISQLIGLIYFRERPFVKNPLIHQLVNVHSKKSLPSDHSCFSFSFAFSIFLIDKKLGILFLILSFLIGLGRVFAGVHYPSDILVSFLISIFSTWFIFKFLGK
jgi:undecaprenyl-diphosphatase